MERQFGLIALVFIVLAIIGIAMVETVAAAKYGVIIVTVYEKTTFGDKICPGASVKLDGVNKGKTNSNGQLHIPTVTLGKDHTTYAEKVCGSSVLPQFKSGSKKFKMSNNQQNVKIVIKYVSIGR